MKIPWRILALLVALTAFGTGCNGWPAPSGPTYVGNQGGGYPVYSGPNAGSWSFLLPQDGTPNGDGTVTAEVVDAGGNTLGEIDFFSSSGAPVTGPDGQALVPDVLIGVSGLADVADPTSPVDSNEIDLAAGELAPGASVSAQAGQLLFTVTVQQANVLVDDTGQPYVDASSLEVTVDVSVV